MQPVEKGAILDLACGSGLATRTLAERFDADRVVGLDISFAMLDLARRAVPDVLLVRGSAVKLPFANASLGAVNCWDALQAIPDPLRAIQEVGRCLRQDGSFTCFTFRKSSGPYRLVQSAIAGVVGSTVVGFQELSHALDAAAMDVVDKSGPGHTLLFTARKR